MRLRYDEETVEKIKCLIEEGKTNSEICSAFGVRDGYPSLCNKCNVLRKELGITLEPKKKVCFPIPVVEASSNKEVGTIKVSGLTKIGSGTKKKSSNTEKRKNAVIGVSDADYKYLSNMISSCSSDIERLRAYVKSRIVDGFSDRELKELKNGTSNIMSVVEDINFIMDNVKLSRKGRK